MKVYRNHYSTVDAGSSGYGYYTSKKEADREAAAWRRDNADDADPDVFQEVLEYPINGRGILMALRDCGSHPNNG